MSIDPTQLPQPPSYGPGKPHETGPQMEGPSDFSRVMNPKTPNVAGNFAPPYTPPNPNAPLKRAPKKSYPQTLPNGLPNAEYYFHFQQSDIMCTDPYPNNPPDPNNYQIYPNAKIQQTKYNNDQSGGEVAVISLPTPYKDPHNAIAKYYNWNYMYVRTSSTANWQYCGVGPQLRVNEVPMKYSLWQHYIPWETEQFILKPLAQDFQKQAQQQAADRKRREKIYRDEGG